MITSHFSRVQVLSEDAVLKVLDLLKNLLVTSILSVIINSGTVTQLTSSIVPLEAGRVNLQRSVFRYRFIDGR